MMRVFFQQLLDILFPPNPTKILVRHCTNDSLNDLYKPRTEATITSLLPYQNPVVRALIHEAKFHRNSHAQSLLARVLARYLQEHSLKNPVTFVPLAAAREKKRGHNQVASVLRQLQKSESVKVVDLLVRTRDTKPQTSLGRTERLPNVAGAFALTSRSELPSAVLLLDDVYTTGATLQAAAKPLTDAGVSVTCIALAH